MAAQRAATKAVAKKAVTKKAAAPRSTTRRATKKASAPPPKPKPMTLTEAVESGDYRKILQAQQREIAKSLQDETGPAKAALMRQLLTISKELKSLGPGDSDAQNDRSSDDVDDEDFSAEAL